MIQVIYFEIPTVDTSNILRNSYGSLCLESLLQIASNVKIIEKRLKQGQRNL